MCTSYCAVPSESIVYKYVDNAIFKINLSRPKAWMSSVNKEFFHSFLFFSLDFFLVKYPISKHKLQAVLD